MRSVLATICGALSLTAATHALAQGQPDSIDAAVRAALAETGAKGLALATIEQGKVQTTRTWGVRNAAGDPLTPDTVMYGASLTKAVFGYFIVQLAAEKRLDLDRPVASMLPKPLPECGNVDGYGNWGDLAGDTRRRTITPRMVLNHATGFANFAFLEPDERLRIHFAPGSRYGYSGEGISLLQFGIERGLGLDLGAELQRRFFEPLRMTRTSLNWREDFALNLADGWDKQGKAEPHDKRSRVRAADHDAPAVPDAAPRCATRRPAQGVGRAGRRGIRRSAGAGLVQGRP